MDQSDPQEVVELIKQVLGVDVTDRRTRMRAWCRIRVYRNIIDECERDGNQRTADALRRIYQLAINGGGDDKSLLALALLAGPDRKHRMTYPIGSSK